MCIGVWDFHITGTSKVPYCTSILTFETVPLKFEEWSVSTRERKYSARNSARNRSVDIDVREMYGCHRFWWDAQMNSQTIVAVVKSPHEELTLVRQL